MKKLAQRFIDLRKEIKVDGKECSQRQLAKILDIKNSRISDIETGKREATLPELIKYHNHFNVTLEYLIGETEAKQAKHEVICEYTGLNEDSIDCLRHHSHHKEFMENAISQLLGDGRKRSQEETEELCRMIEASAKADEEFKKTINFLLGGHAFYYMVSEISRYLEITEDSINYRIDKILGNTPAGSGWVEPECIERSEKQEEELDKALDCVKANGYIYYESHEEVEILEAKITNEFAKIINRKYDISFAEFKASNEEAKKKERGSNNG